MNKMITELKNKRFKQKLNDVTFTQRECINPVIIKGEGELYQNGNGVMEVRIVAKTSDHSHSHVMDSEDVGLVKPEHRYYDLVATDSQGIQWNAKRIIVRNPTADKHVISSSIPSIERNLSLCNENHRYKSILNFQSKDLSNRNLFIQIYDVSINILIEDDFVDVYIESNDSIRSEKISNSIYKPLSILLGKQICPIASETYSVNDCKQTIYSVNNELVGKSLYAPLGDLYNVNDGEQFIKLYLAKITLDNYGCDKIFPSWHDALICNQSSIHGALYSRSSQIEGLVKSYFKDRYGKSTDYRNDLKIAEKLIKSLPSDNQAKNDILSNMGNLKTKAPKRIVSELCEEMHVNVDCLDAWNEIRNRKSHGEIAVYDNIGLKYEIDRMNKSLYLMYRIILKIINFNGYCKDFSTEGFPLIKVN